MFQRACYIQINSRSNLEKLTNNVIHVHNTKNAEGHNNKTNYPKKKIKINHTKNSTDQKHTIYQASTNLQHKLKYLTTVP